MGRRTIGKVRRCGEIDPKADHDPVTLPLQQDSSDLRPIEKQVVGPFEQQRQVGRGRIERLDQGQPGRERQRLRRRIARGERDERASEEVAALCDPLATLTTLSGGLLERDQPVAFIRGSVGKEVGVGRARGLDDPDSAQSSAPAARSARLPSGPMRR